MKTEAEILAMIEKFREELKRDLNQADVLWHDIMEERRKRAAMPDVDPNDPTLPGLLRRQAM